MNRLQQAMLVNAKFDHYYATTDEPSEIGQFNAIYDALLEIDELINAAESEQLDEEVEYDLTPAGQSFLDAREAAEAEDRYVDEIEDATWQNANPNQVLPYVDISEDFSEFSPSVGTFEGTVELAKLVGRDYKALVDQATSTEYDRFVGRAPVGERVYRTATGVAEIIGRTFEPCGAD